MMLTSGPLEIVLPAMLLAMCVCAHAQEAELKPRVIQTKYPTEDIVVAMAVATEAPFSAKGDGQTDCTAAIQAAIDAVAKAGGGVVFLPEGRYLCKGNLLLRETVTLRGDWRSPEKDPKVVGTILMPTAGRGNADGPEFISMERGTGVRNVTIWYPEQTPEQIVPYPWTLRTNKEKVGNNMTIYHVTLVNSYQGMRFGSEWNELHTVRDVHGTPLACGIWMDFCTDIGRLMHVRVEPRYWLNSGLTEQTEKNRNAMEAFMGEKGTGIFLGRSDWEYFYDVKLVGYARGIHVTRAGNTGLDTNAVFYDVDVSGGRIGLQVDAVNHIGLALTRCRFDGSEAGVLRTAPQAGICQFNDCVIGGRAKDGARNEGGKLSFQNCRFPGWSSAGVMAANGSVSILGCAFQGTGTAVRLGAGVSRGLILGNTFAGEPQLDIQSKGDIQISHHDFKFARPSAEPIVLPPDPRPATDKLFNVLAHGAKADAAADNTAAFQAALDAAGKAGGGTVYVPAGNYGVKGTLTVPTGVELRGCFDVPHHTVSGGSALMITAGRGQEDGTPFITLSPKAGIRGMTFWYPEQDIRNVVAYPWAIRSGGPGCWVLDVSVGNAYQGADFGTNPSDGHLLRYLCGAPLRRGLWVSKGSGVVDSCHFNPHFWARRPAGFPAPGARLDDGKLIEMVWEYQGRNLDAFIFGRCARTIQVNNFTYSHLHGLHFVDDGGGSSGRVINHGSDRAASGVTVEASGTDGIELINTEIACFDKACLSVTDAFAGRLSFFNTLSWWGGSAGTLRGKGRVLLQQWHTGAPQVLHIEGGQADVQNLNVVQGGEQVRINAVASAVRLIGNSSQKDDLFRFTPGSNATGFANALMTGTSAPGTFETGFEIGQPVPGQNVRSLAVNNVAGATCRVVPDAGRAGKAGLVLEGEARGDKAPHVYFAAFETSVAVGQSS
ncbi:MAG: glycosyl hydrolase family 28-related protein, partial [bacterium]